MNKWWPKILLGFCVIVVSSAFLVWSILQSEPVAPGLERGVRQIVKRYPTLQPRLDQATADGVLTMSEANAIVAAAENLKTHPQP